VDRGAADGELVGLVLPVPGHDGLVHVGVAGDVRFAERVGDTAAAVADQTRVTFQRIKTWKESNDPQREAKLARIDPRR